VAAAAAVSAAAAMATERVEAWGSARVMAVPTEVVVLRAKAAEGAEEVRKEVRARAPKEVGVLRVAPERGCTHTPCDDCPCQLLSQ